MDQYKMIFFNNESVISCDNPESIQHLMPEIDLLIKLIEE